MFMALPFSFLPLIAVLEEGEILRYTDGVTTVGHMSEEVHWPFHTLQRQKPPCGGAVTLSITAWAITPQVEQEFSAQKAVDKGVYCHCDWLVNFWQFLKEFTIGTFEALFEATYMNWTKSSTGPVCAKVSKICASILQEDHRLGYRKEVESDGETFGATSVQNKVFDPSNQFMSWLFEHRCDAVGWIFVEVPKSPTASSPPPKGGSV
jgi:hypothetical protein